MPSVATIVKEPFGLPSLEEGLVNERKLVGPAFLAPRAIAWLTSSTVPDSCFPEGKLHSIYFDSPNLDSYGEKINGDNLKMKVRLRWYETDAPVDAEVPCYLEMKLRIGAARRKARVKLSARSGWLRHTPLMDASFGRFLAAHAPELPHPIPHHWVPSICVTYRRRRFFCPQTETRVAVDWDIHADRGNSLLLPAVGPVRLDCSLCEFKNEGGGAPPWLEGLFEAGYRLRAHSKYASLIELASRGLPF